MPTSAFESALSMPMNACKNPTMMTIKSAKKMSDSFIMTFNTTTSIAPKNLMLSRYNSNLIQNIGAEKASKSGLHLLGKG